MRPAIANHHKLYWYKTIRNLLQVIFDRFLAESLQENHRLCQTRGTGIPCWKTTRRHPELRKRLLTAGGWFWSAPGHLVEGVWRQKAQNTQRFQEHHWWCVQKHRQMQKNVREKSRRMSKYLEIQECKCLESYPRRLEAGKPTPLFSSYCFHREAPWH